MIDIQRNWARFYVSWALRLAEFEEHGPKSDAERFAKIAELLAEAAKHLEAA